MVRTLLGLCCLLVCSPAFGQQDYVSRFDVYGGFGYLDSPKFHLAERGFHLQAGLNLRTWLAFGFDYSIFTGNTDLHAGDLTNTLQQQLTAQFTPLVLAGIIPPTYQLDAPIDSTTHTFALGPQLMIRHWKPVTLFVRPSIGAIHEIATPHYTDPIETQVIHQLAPSGKATDWTGFYGFGGGAEINMARHFSLRLQADYVRNHLFSDLLRDSRNTYRLSIGPAFHFGPNIVK